ncbi:MAG: transporter substrate-binding domain-containing protein [Nostocoides sp.]
MQLTNRKRGRAAAVATAALLAASALAACGDSDGSSGGSDAGPQKSPLYKEEVHKLLPEDVVKKGFVVDGVSNASPPTSYVDKNGKYAGYEAEMSALFSQVMGIEIQTPTPIAFDGIVPGIAAGRFDFGNMNDTVVRQKTMDFVDLLYAGPGLLVKEGNPLKVDENSLCGHTVSGQKGSVYTINTLPDMSAKCTAAGKPAIKVTVFPDTNAAILALNAGRTDVVMDDTQTVAWIAKETPGLEFVETSIKSGLWGYGFTKGSKLVPAFKAAAEELHKNGKLDAILDKYDIKSLRVENISVNGTKEG